MGRTCLVFLLITLTSCGALRSSQLAVGGCTAFDAARSWGHSERVPWMRSPDGTFRGRGASIKAASVGVLLGTQEATKGARWVPWMNWGVAGALCGAGAVR